METVNIKMYTGVSVDDGVNVLVAHINGKECAESTYTGDSDSWLSPEGFIPFYNIFPTYDCECVDETISPKKLIWDVDVKSEKLGLIGDKS